MKSPVMECELWTNSMKPLESKNLDNEKAFC